MVTLVTLMVQQKDEWFYVQVHFISDQGIKTLTNEEAGALAGSSRLRSRDLFKNIAAGNYPSWTAYIQTMTEAEAKS